jgi:hypothetical protein
MSEKSIKKIELSKEFILSFEQSKEKLTSYGVEGFTIGEYIEFLQSTVQQEAIDEFLESKIPLKARLLTALEKGDESFLTDMQRLLEKQIRMKARKQNPKDSSDL